MLATGHHSFGTLHVGHSQIVELFSLDFKISPFSFQVNNDLRKKSLTQVSLTFWVATRKLASFSWLLEEHQEESVEEGT